MWLTGEIFALTSKSWRDIPNKVAGVLFDFFFFVFFYLHRANEGTYTELSLLKRQSQIENMHAEHRNSTVFNSWGLQT